MSLGHRIRFIRRSLSQDDFGYMLAVHRNTVCAWECDEDMPKGRVVKALFMLFNVNLNWMFSGKGEPYLDDINQTSESANLIMEPENE